MGGEEAARVIKMVGSRRNLGLEVKDHMAVGTALDLIDFETGANVSGAKCALFVTSPFRWDVFFHMLR